MKNRFRERLGLFNKKTTIPKDKMPDDLRNTLWSISCEKIAQIPNDKSYGNHLTDLSEFFKFLWRDFFKKPIDTLEISNGVINPEKHYEYLRNWYFDAKWYEIYEYLEYCADIFEPPFIAECNEYLERELSAFRFVGTTLLEIDSTEEIKEIESAINSGSKYKPIKIHLETSLKLLTNKRKPDYRNSIKESISSVESLCKIICKNDNTSLGQALKMIDKIEPLPKSLKSGFSSIYGYTSDHGGIRHGILSDEIEPKYYEAKFMLVTCSAFVNYLISKYE